MTDSPTPSLELENTTDIADDQLPLEQLRKMFAHHYAALHLGPAVELSVTFVDEPTIEELHVRWLDLPGPTDVMSFPMDELRAGTAEEPVEDGILGDIVICPSVAAAQAEGHSTDDEILLLATHGLLHLLGHDHYEPAERSEMFQLQEQLLSSFLGRPAPTSATAGQ
ncbi:rRNA maturation RNase YbeY [Micrococcoides hystricis]|uniref:Endoribonuclease YbeY n=1 Tax=Micrococcoides hystricis TaxID=1572761 RepID=A0ABV6P9J8_9MICC